jgi:hypothetical protein
MQDQIAFLAEQGTICLPADLPCLQKLAILCDVQVLLIAESTGERELDVTLTVLNAEDAAVLRAVKGVVNLATDSAKKLTARALHGEEEGAPPPPPPPRDPIKVKPGDPVDETQLNDLQLAGAATAAVGGGLGALSLLGALSCEAIFWTGIGSKDTRKDIVAPLGGVLWIASIVGGLVAGAGGGLYLAGAPPEEKTVDSLP